jgi:hypothetical protein
MTDLTMVGYYVRWQYAGMVGRCTEWRQSLGCCFAWRNWMVGHDGQNQRSDYTRERSNNRKTASSAFGRLTNFLFKSSEDPARSQTRKNIEIADEYALTMRSLINNRLDLLADEIQSRDKKE